MTDAKREQLWAQLWKAIADVRDASPRVPSDADTDEIVAAVMPVVDELTAALDRVRAWADSMEHDFQGSPSLYGAAIATEVRNRIAGEVTS